MTMAFETSKSQRPRWPLVLCIGFVTIGMLLVVGSLFLTVRSKQWVKTAVHTQGTIVTIKPAPRSDNGSQTFFPVYEASADDGHTFNVTGTVSSYPAPTIGASTRLAYPPGKPDEAVALGFLGVWFFPMIVGAIGAVLTLIGLITLLVASHPKKARPSTA